jgi:hypothetical protein
VDILHRYQKGFIIHRILYHLFIHISISLLSFHSQQKNILSCLMPTHYLGGIVCYKHIIHSHHSFNGFFHLLIVAVFGRFPYLLPCLCVSIFCFITLISCIWLPVCKLSSCYYIGHYINSYLFFVHSFHSILLPLEIS